MIETAEQLYQAIEQMGRMQRILESYRNEILTKNPRNFAALAEGPLEQLRQLQSQIDEYLQRLQSTGLPGRA
jgi:transcription termination factor NusB